MAEKFYAYCNSTKKRMQKLQSYFTTHYYFEYLIFALITFFICEILSRRSLFSAIQFIVLHPIVAFLNILIITGTLLVGTLFKRQKFWKYFGCLFWIVLALSNCIMQGYRLMPFNFMDILLIPSTFTVLTKYLAIWQLILIALFLIALITALVFAYKNTIKCIVDYKKNVIVVVLMLCITFAYYHALLSSNLIDNKIPGLSNKYDNYGFSYCYASSMLDMGMHKPPDYSTAQVETIVHDLNKKNTGKVRKPNIIFLQLESFFDVNKIQKFSYSENPLPVFSELLQKYSHGYLNVPTFSAGTANTEFEVLTGMDMDFFGIGEFPYQTVLTDQTCESVSYVLNSMNYTSHAIHDNAATFYNRNEIYANLGFNTFTSIEYMYNVEYNVLGWARDKALVSSITDALHSTTGRDFIYTVGVQTHGTYPDDAIDTAHAISVSGIADPELKKSYEYYLGQIREVDAFIGALVSELETEKEPTVLVLFGDHMPGFEIEDQDLINKNKYQTEYVLWSNYVMDMQVKDVEAYQLYSYVFKRLNFAGGVLSKLHQKYDFNTANSAYLKNLELLQYDMIYGKNDVYKGKKYEPTDLKMGIKKINIESANVHGGSLYVHGNNFNKFSVVCIDGEKYTTKYINASNLEVTGLVPEKDSFITVAQIDTKSNILSSSNSYHLK